MSSYEHVRLTRECKATEIPSGELIVLPQGTEVTITQTLGGNFTVTTDMGNMARIEAIDSDALGKEVAPAEPLPETGGEEAPVDESVIWDLLKCVYDPEIPVNIVDLGLVYECRLTSLPDGGKRAEVKFTMTAPGCGMGDVLQADIERRISNLSGITEVMAEVVLDPPWTPDRMSEAAKLELGMA
jgi:probable FeS assembly SUF system protein SufT